MKRIIGIVALSLLLIGCSPSEEIVQNTQTPIPEPTNTATIEPTSTPEYCPEADTVEGVDELNIQHDIFALMYNVGIEDYNKHEELAVQFTKMIIELEDYEVPGCLEYTKELLITTIQNAIDAFKQNMAGNQSGYREHLVDLNINIELFYDERDRILECLPGCEP